MQIRNSVLWNSCNQNCISKHRVREKIKTKYKQRVLSFPVVIDDVASSTRLICCRRALSRRIIIIILGHFPLTFEYFHSKFNNFKALGEPEVPPPIFFSCSSFLALLFSRFVLLSFAFVSILLRVRVEQSAHTFYSWAKISHTFKSKRSATKPNSHSYIYRVCEANK